MAGDRGNVTPAVVGLSAIVLVLLLGLGDLGIFLLARSKAQTAADAAALAAVAELIPGSRGEPHIEAARFAQANGARLLGCDCREGGRAAMVRVGVQVRFGIVRGVKEVTARARAEVDLDRFPVHEGGPQ